LIVAYKAKATRNEDGSYTLSYGKGSKKLTALVSNMHGKFYVAIPDREPNEVVGKKREVIAAWGEWAASNYEGSMPQPPANADNEQTHATTIDAPHSPHSGPPKHGGSGGPPKKHGKNIAESKSVVGLDGQRRRISYSEEGSYAHPPLDDDEPLPVWPADREVIATAGGYDVCQQVASDRFPYLEGYALVERKTNTQTGWTKQRERAFESLLERKEADRVRPPQSSNAKTVRAQAPVADATASAEPAPDEAESTDDHASGDDAESGVPSGPGADAEVQSELFGAEESADEVG
jgi:hypothetical protein